MKKLHFSLFCLLFSAQALFAQGIVFQQGSFEKVLKKAAREHKLVFVQIDNPNCLQCTEVASRGFADPALTEKFAVNFVSYRTSASADEGKALLSQFELKGSLAALFLTADGSLLNWYSGSTSFGYAYLREADKALANRNQTPLNQLMARFAQGERSPEFLRTYINRKQELRLPFDDLLDAYVREIPLDSLQSETTLRFLIEHSPILGTKADSVSRMVWSRRNTLFMSYPTPKRVEFNQEVSRKTLQRAIETKNERLALSNARNTADTYGNDRLGRQWSYEANLMNYYLGVKDTTMYIQTASRFYDKYLMPIDPDSVNRVERQQRFETARQQQPGNQVMVQMGMSRFGRDLNQAAWKFWQLATKPEDLEKALVWSKRAREYSEEANTIDTYARLLYKLGRRNEAIQEAERAVQRQKTRNIPSQSFELTLQKMKDGTLQPEPDNVN